MISMRYEQFYRKYITRTWSKLRTPLISKVEDYKLPRSCIVHFVPETNHEFGIDPSHSLMRNIGDQCLIHHVTNLDPHHGRVRHININPETMIRNYHKRFKNYIRVRNLDKSMINDRLHMVVNYSLIPHLNIQLHNSLMIHQEWNNMRDCMWRTIREMGDMRYHVIPFKIPTYIPAKMDFIRYSKDMTITGLKQFHDKEQFDLLELWGIVNDAAAGLEFTKLKPEIVEKTFLVFIESNKVITIQLKDLLEWSKDNKNQIQTVFYQFMDYLLTLRTPVNTGDIVTAATAKPVDETKEEFINEEKLENVPEEKLSEQQIEDRLMQAVSNYEDLLIEDNLEIHPIANTAIEEKIQERALAGGLSGAEQRGLTKLADKWKSIPDPFNPGATLGDMKITEQDICIEDKPIMEKKISIHDESMVHSRIHNFDKQYVDKVLHKDIINMGLAVQNAGLIVKNVKVKEINDAATQAEEFSIQVQPVVGAVSTFKFKVPKIKKDGTFFVNNTKYRMDKMKGEPPIAKLRSHTVCLTSYYGKCFIVRNQNVASNYSRWIKGKIVKSVLDNEDSSVSEIIHGDNDYKGLHLPRAYTSVTRKIGGFTTPKYKFFLNYHKLNTFFSEEEIEFCKKNDLIPIARSTMSKAIYLAMDSNGLINEVKTGKLEPLGTLTNVINPEWGNGPMEYCEVSVFNRRIPVILALVYKDGLTNTFKKLGVNFTSIPPTARYNVTENTYRLKLKDESLIIDIRNPEIKLLIGGFNAVRKSLPEYTARELDKRSTFNYLLAGNGFNNHHLRELLLMFDMFIDPITLELLKDMKEPTTFGKLLIRANQLLIDDWVPEQEEYRYKGYERMSGMVYNQIVNSVRGFRSKGNQPEAEFSLNPMSVWLDIIQDPSISLIEESNPIHNLKEKESVTFSGQGGRSSVTMVKDTRGFQEGDIGIISEATPDGGKVGIRTYTTADPNIINLRGKSRPFNPNIDGNSGLISTSALLAPGSIHDDSKRVNFISIQNSSTVMAKGYELSPYRTGYEQVIAHRTDESFTVQAKEDGIVKSVDENHILIEYKSGKTEAVVLGKKHGMVSGMTVPHLIKTTFKLGDKVKTGNIIAYDDGFFTTDIFNKGSVSYKGSCICKTVLWESSETNEDSCVVSKEFTKKLETDISYTKSVMVDFKTAIHNLIKVGTHVEHDTILCTLQDAISAEMTKSDSEAIKALQKIASANPKAKCHGVVSSIEVLYNGDVNEMHPTLQEIVKADTRKRSARAKLLNDGSPTTGEIHDPIHFDTQKLLKGYIGIKIHIDSDLGITAGDKLVFANMLKTTIGRVSPETMTTESGETVHAMFGYQSVCNRIVYSPEILGTMNAVLKKLSKEMVNIYKKG